MTESYRLSRRDFLKLLGASAVVGVLGKFVNFAPQNIQPQSIIREASAQSLGSWSLGQNTLIPPIHTALLRNGKIMYVAGSGWDQNAKFGPFRAAVLDLNTNSESIYETTDDLFCCGFSHLTNGNILIAGGTKDYDDVAGDGKWHGTKVAYEFDVDSSTFYKVPSMAHGRWYPSMVALPEGKAMVTTGFDEYGTVNALMEIYDPTFKSFNIKYDPTSNRQYCVGSGSSLPGSGTPCYGGGPNKGTNISVGIYSRMIVMPSGLVIKAGQQQSLDTWNPTTGEWRDAGDMQVVGRTYGTAVLLPLNNTTSERGRVLICGGQLSAGGATMNSAEILDFNAGTNLSPVISSTAPMNHARMYLMPVMLPTGKVVMFGGTSGANVNPVLIPEMFDPVSVPNTWTDLPPATVPRQYHSSAILLPDGRVWTASGTPGMGLFENRTEFFSPWYFFAGPRPTINGSPTNGTYGGTITIPTPEASTISSVSLLSLPNHTHHFDSELRLIWLQIQSTSPANVVVSAPINANLAPPGYYLIHVLNSSGVPSEGKIIKIGTASAGGSDTTPPTVGIYRPSARAVISGPASGVIINVAGTATDSQSGVESVMVSIDSNSGSSATSGIAGDWSTWSFSTIITTKGPHTIKAVATDHAGNKASATIPVTISFN